MTRLLHGKDVSFAGPLRTAAEMIRHAGLDWQVEKRPAFYPKRQTALATMDMSKALPGGSFLGDMRCVPWGHVTVRADTDEPLGMVGPDYTVMQNADAFQLADDILDASSAVYQRAGELEGGARVFALARLPKDIYVQHKDAIATFLCVSTRHDGGGSAMVDVVPIRSACTNGLIFPVPGYTRRFALRHTSGMMERAKKAREALGVTFRYLETVEAMCNRLSEVTLTQDEFDAFLQDLFPAPRADGGAPKQTQDRRIAVGSLYYHAENLEGFRGTAWAAVNAAVEYHNHVRPVRGLTAGRNEDAVRTDRVLFDAQGIGAAALASLQRVRTDLALPVGTRN